MSKKEYTINGRIVQYVSAVIEAEDVDEAMVKAEEAFANGDCMLGDAEVEIEEYEDEEI